MTLDLILFRPEFYQLFGFFVLLWYGTGNLVTPVAEILTVTKQNRFNVVPSSHLHGAVHSGGTNITTRHRRVSPHEAMAGQSSGGPRGPNHAASALTLWAVTWCFLSFLQAVYSPLHIVFLGGSFQKDAYSLQQCRLLFLTGCFVLLVSYGWQKVARICHTEYVYQAMQAQMGQYQQIMATDQMSLYLCMEQQSFSLVVLCGLNSKSAYSLEAAMKYFLQSAFRSCQLLLGVRFIYWQTGETSQPHIEKIVERTRNNPSQLTALGIWLISTGQLWKLAAAPQHFWVPDVYMGAWSSVSLWITVQPKIAVLGFWTHHWHTIWSASFGNTQILFRALSMIVGRIAPLAQTNIKRQLAYSSVGHNGLLLIPQCRGNSTDSFAVMWRYFIIYIIVNIGVWSQMQWPMDIPTNNTRKGSVRPNPQFLWHLKGQNNSSPRIAFRWAVFMTSFAGLPPVYSFLGKAAILWHRVNYKLYVLVAVLLVYTMIGSVYYLKVMKIAYVDATTRWRTYKKPSPLTAFIRAISVFIMLVGQWRGNALFQFTHIQALSASNYFLYFQLTASALLAYIRIHYQLHRAEASVLPQNRDAEKWSRAPCAWIMCCWASASLHCITQPSAQCIIS